MLPITKLLTNYNRTKMTNKQNKYIVIHWVGGVSSAKNNATYFKNNELSSSAHYFVDDASIYQSVEDSDRAWHCGTTGKYYHDDCRNSNSIGIEMCLDKANHISDTTIKNTAELVKYLLNKYNIPASNVVRHYDVTRKQCPAIYVDATKWATLKATLVDTKISATSTTGTGTMTVRVKTNLAVRKTWNEVSTVLAKLSNGDKVNVLKLGKVWAKIKYGSGVGYVKKKYLTSTMTVNSSDGLNVRKTYSINTTKLGVLSNGTKVEVISLGTTWAKIVYKNDIGYVYKKYLK